jgi:hypothetical protein
MGEVFKIQTVDRETGEVIIETEVSIRKYYEKFFSCRATDGIKWINNFDYHELRMMMLLNKFEELNGHVIMLSVFARDEICEFFGFTVRHVYRILNRLIEKHAMIRLTDNQYLMNPAYFYKGSSKELSRRIKQFYALYNKTYNTDLSYFDKVFEEKRDNTVLNSPIAEGNTEGRESV